MKKSIVVGVNDSGSSEAAVEWAMKRAARLKLPVVLVHAVDDRWSSEAPEFHNVLSKAGHALVARAQARALELEPGVHVEAMMMWGSPGYVLKRQSKRAEMMVVGSGSSWPRGPVTDRALQVAAAAACPVAVIAGAKDDGGAAAASGTGVLVGVDGSEESVQAVAFAAAEADRMGQELTVLHVFGAATRWVERGIPESDLAKFIAEEEELIMGETVAGLADKYPDLVVHRVLDSQHEPAVALVAAAQHAALLVLGSRGAGGFKRLMLGSTAHAVLTEVPCPTIITRLTKVKLSK
ncbi:universal stress protein [Pseudarthrobacter sp. J1738]|uniref:universal stress protein n=1 Tax=Pseudarthrobacter sp. J1738 TaxID=3420446 RepID=UPI003D28E90B